MGVFLLPSKVIIPLFFLMLTGYLVRKTSLIEEDILIKANRLNYYLALPASCLISIYQSDFSAINGPKLFLTVAVSILFVFLLSVLIISRFCHTPAKRGSLIMAVSRSNDVIFGLAVANSLLPKERLAPVMLSISISAILFNLTSVCAMEVNRGGKIRFISIIKQICLNPIIIGCAAGLLLALSHTTVPPLVLSPIQSLANMVTPLSFIIIGSRIHRSAFIRDRKIIALVSLVKLVVLPVIMLTVAFLLKLDDAGMIAILCIFGAPCATASYTFACEMGGDEQLSSELIASTSAFSLISMFFMIYILKLLGGI